VELDVVVPRITPTATAVDLTIGRLEVREIRLGNHARSAVVILCAAADLDSFAADRMNGLAEHGYETLATDLDRAGTSRPDRAAVVDELVARLNDRGWDRDQIALIGYGEGASTVLAATANCPVATAVSVAPTELSGDRGARPRVPWLGMFGELDRIVTPEDVATLASRLADIDVYTRTVVYPGVGADFYRDTADSLGHTAAFDSWQRVVEWLNARVAPRPTPYAQIWNSRQQNKS